MMTCTTLDHCYPQNAPDRKTAAGTPCYCRRRTWAGAPRIKQQRRLRAGTVVTVAGAAHEGTRTVLKALRGEASCYVLDAPVYGRRYYEAAELEVTRLRADANDRRFAAGLLAGHAIKAGQPIVFCKGEHPYVVVTTYDNRADYIAGKHNGLRVRTWMTPRSAKALAKKLGAAVVEF